MTGLSAVGREGATATHRHRVVQRHHVQRSLHGAHPIGRFNAAAASRISEVLSSMWFFWFCLALDLCELPAVVASRQLVLWVAYVSQTVIQLLALPALGAAGKLISALQDEQAQAQGETLQATHDLLAEVHEINLRQTRMLDQIRTSLPGSAGVPNGAPKEPEP